MREEGEGLGGGGSGDDDGGGARQGSRAARRHERRDVFMDRLSVAAGEVRGASCSPSRGEFVQSDAGRADHRVFGAGASEPESLVRVFFACCCEGRAAGA